MLSWLKTDISLAMQFPFFSVTTGLPGLASPGSFAAIWGMVDTLDLPQPYDYAISALLWADLAQALSTAVLYAFTREVSPLNKNYHW